MKLPTSVTLAILQVSTTCVSSGQKRDDEEELEVKGKEKEKEKIKGKRRIRSKERERGEREGEKEKGKRWITGRWRGTRRRLMTVWVPRHIPLNDDVT